MLSSESHKEIKNRLYSVFDKKYFGFSVNVIDRRIINIQVTKSPIEYKFREKDHTFLYKNFPTTMIHLRRIQNYIKYCISSLYPDYDEKCVLGFPKYEVMITFGKSSRYMDPEYEYVSYKRTVTDNEKACEVLNQVDKKIEIRNKLKDSYLTPVGPV